jgi:hypothetical protein
MYTTSEPLNVEPLNLWMTLQQDVLRSGFSAWNLNLKGFIWAAKNPEY